MDLKHKVTLSLALALFVFAAISPIACCDDEEPKKTKNFGGPINVVRNTDEIEKIAKFAVQEHNNNKNAMLKFVKVVKASEQVVAGKIYNLTLEAIDGEEKKTFEAKVWVKPWENYKELQDFKEDNASLASSDIGVGHGRG